MDSGTDNPCGLGFPIRKSAGQRVLASHRSLSQRATSFIACVRQGIPQTPLHKRLIAQHFVPCPEIKPAIVSALPRNSRWIVSEMVTHIAISWCLSDPPVVQPANPAFTMSNIREDVRTRWNALCLRSSDDVFRHTDCRCVART